MDRTLRGAKIMALVVFCALAPIAMWIGGRFALTLSAAEGWSFTSSELVTVLLTGLTISIAVMAAVIGLVAIWGYHAIKDEARGIARRSAEKYLAGKGVEQKIRTLAAPIVAEEVEKAIQALQLPRPIDNTGTMGAGEETEKVGDPYPKDGDS